MIQAGIADLVCFSPFRVGTLRRFHELAGLAALRGQRVLKHTHGELGIAASAAHHPLLTLPGLADGCQHTHGLTDGDVLAEPLPIAAGPTWGIPDRAGLGIAVDGARVAEAQARCRRDGPYLPYAA